jgi:hypothetical protein
MHDETLKVIKAKYGISNDDLNSILTEIRKRIKILHPDSNHGNLKNISDFTSEQEKEIFLALVKDKEYIENCLRQELIPYSTVKEIIDSEHDRALESYKEINKNLIKTTEYSDARKILSDNLDNNLFKIRFSNLLPKISVSGITAILTIIWLFPVTIQNHPIISKFIDVNSSFFLVIWLELLIITIIFWVIVFRVEKCQIKILKLLKNDFFQESCIFHFIGERKLFTAYDDYSEKGFSKSVFINYIYYYLYSMAKTTNFSNCTFMEYNNIQLSSIDFVKLMEAPIDLTRYGEISIIDFKRFDRKPLSLLTRLLIYNLDFCLDSETIQNFSNSVLIKAELKGMIERLPNHPVIYNELYNVKFPI